ncbi:hypothetical protein QOZ80_8BG0669150 [Eleusine coracana subsp. coracana]|nr:hypothetical protein QOZ80_8BG0669150 [Eleusine coracana subsp. coracana]
MREQLSCFGDSSVGVATSVSGGGALDRALQAATTSVYRAALPSSSSSSSSGKEMLIIRVTWTRSAAGAPGLAVAFDEQEQGDLSPSSSSASRKKKNKSQQQQQLVLQKRRGSRSLVTGGGTVVGVHWDTAEAKYTSTAEPDGGEYYLAVVADGALALLLGSGRAARQLTRRHGFFIGSDGFSIGSAALVSRREQVRVGGSTAAAAHVTRCRFSEGGEEHEVAVHTSPRRRRTGEEVVWVSIDGEKVAEVRRVGWGFRGNRAAVLPDGEIVDVMWDVHDWWFGGNGGNNGAQFMVRARAEKEGRLWMAADERHAAAGGGGFFLHVQCYPR